MPSVLLLWYTGQIIKLYSMIEVKNLNFSYGKKNYFVFEDLSLDICNGKIYGLLGENGAGKSSLLYLISGLLTPKNGKVFIDEKDVRKRTADVLSTLAILPEVFSFPDLTVAQFIKINKPFYKNFSEEDFYKYLEIFNLSKYINVKFLSMGQSKKFYISFILACNTRYVFMDEPTNGLDIPSKNSFRKIISLAASEEKTIVISTHQVHDIEKLIDHIVILDHSKVYLNESVYNLVKKLKFVETNDRELIEKAIYTENTPGGVKAILARDESDDEETEIDVELLFDAVTSKENIFNSKFNK